MSEDKSQYDDGVRVAELAAKRLKEVDITVTTEGTKDQALNYFKNHPEYASLIASELDKLIVSYNNLTIDSSNEERLLSVAKLKKVIPQLPQIGDLMTGKNTSEASRSWKMAYLSAIRTSIARITRGNIEGKNKTTDELMELDKDPEIYVHQLFDTHPRAMLLAVAYHLYEDTIDRSQHLKGKVPGKDTITNALVEMLIEEHQDSLLYGLTGNPASDQEDGGLDWIHGYEGFSEELLNKAK